MSWGAVAAVGSAAIGAAGASSAAKKQQQAANAATAAELQQTNKAIAMQEPFYNGGTAAQNRLMELMGLDLGYDQNEYQRIYNDLRAKNSAEHAQQFGFTYDGAPGWAAAEIAATEDRLKEEAKRIAMSQYDPSAQTRSADFGSLMRNFTMADFEADPGYQFRMDEGMRGVEGGAAAQGGLLSGAALKAIQKYGQGLASQEYGNAYGRFEANKTNNFNRLTGMVQSGQGAAQQTGNAALNFGQQQANNLIGAGNAQASGIMGATNALVGGVNQGINTYQQNQMLKQMNEQNQLMKMISSPTAGGWGSGNAYGNQDLGRNF